MRKPFQLVFAFVALAVPMWAQQGDLRSEVDALRRQLSDAMADQARLGTTHERIAESLGDEQVRRDGDLEQRILALSREVQSISVTDVRSIANPIEIFGDFRTRLHYFNNRDFGNDLPGVGGGSPGGVDAGDDEGWAMRACYLIGFDFRFDRHVTTHFAVQSHGVFANGDTPGDERFNNGPPFDKGVLGGQAGVLDEIDLYEGWIQIDHIFGNEDLSWRVGRQELVFGNEFVFGNNDFFTGEVHDGGVVYYDNANFDLTGFYLTHAFTDSFSPRNHPYASAGNGFDDDTLTGLYFAWHGVRSFAFDAYYAFFDGNNGGSRGTLGNSLSQAQTGDLALEASGLDAFYHIMGFRIYGVISGLADGLDYNLEFVYQTGDLQDVQQDVEGVALEVELGLMISRQHQARIFTRFLYSEGGDADDTGYIPLFTERHAYAGEGGWTDYRARYGLMNIIPLENVITVQAGGYFDIAPDWTLGATVLWATLDRSNPSVDGDDDIGVEVDLWVEHRYSAQAVATFGLGLFFPDDSAPLPKGSALLDGDDDTAVLVYADLRVFF